MKENSMEEDIKDIKKYISFTSKRENFSHDTDWNWNKDLANKIEHILSDYKRVLQENEKLKAKLLDTLEGQKIIKEETPQYIKENYILKEKVKDKIEELKNISNTEELEDIMNRKNYTISELVQYILQELLAERKEN